MWAVCQCCTKPKDNPLQHIQTYATYTRITHQMQHFAFFTKILLNFFFVVFVKNQKCGNCVKYKNMLLAVRITIRCADKHIHTFLMWQVCLLCHKRAYSLLPQSPFVARCFSCKLSSWKQSVLCVPGCQKHTHTYNTNMYVHMCLSCFLKGTT